MNGRFPFTSFESFRKNGNQHISALHFFCIPDAIALLIQVVCQVI